MIVGGSAFSCSASAAFRSPAAPAADFVWPIWDFTDPSAHHCRSARPLSPNAVKLLRLLLHGRFADVARVNVDAGLAAELERAMLEYVRWVLERDVRSAAFIDTVRRRARRLARTPLSPSSLA